MKLTKEQKKLAKDITTLNKKFVINLVSKDMSQREAYLAAGGTAKTENAQDNAASVMLSNSKVRAFYDSLIESAACSAVLTKQKALEILSHSANVSITDICDFVEVPDGKDKTKHIWRVKDFNTVPPEIARCVKSVKITADGPKIELYDSHGAIKQLSDMIGWNVPRRTQISGPEDAPIETKLTVTFVDAAKTVEPNEGEEGEEDEEK